MSVPLVGTTEKSAVQLGRQQQGFGTVNRSMTLAKRCSLSLSRSRWRLSSSHCVVQSRAEVTFG